jgi:nucleoside-diphosphate-sugar epimerase
VEPSGPHSLVAPDDLLHLRQALQATGNRLTEWDTAKAIDEILSHAYWRDRNLPTIVARPFNCVGAPTGAYGC